MSLAKIFLERNRDFSVTTLESAQDALIYLTSHPVDAIISDYQMPGMNGIEFLKAVRAKGDTTPFIIFTGKGREEVVIEALNNGADFYIQKGGEPKAQFAELVHIIKRAVQHRLNEQTIYKKAKEETRLLNSLHVYKTELDAQLTEHEIREEEAQKKTQGFLEKTEKELRQYKFFYDLAPAGFLRLDSIGTILSVNRKGEEIFGAAINDIIGHSFATFVALPYRKAWGKFLEEIFRAGTIQTLEMEVIAGSGAVTPVRIDAVRSHDDETCLCVLTVSFRQRNAV